MKALKIIKPGFFTTIQDIGRSGLMRYGIPSSGAMDQYSYQLGNLLLGNSKYSASLEIILSGLCIEAIIPVTVAITGADLCPYLNDTMVPLWTPLTLKKGEILHFKRRRNGFWAYLAVRGGLDVPTVLGSKSAFLRGKIGKRLGKGETLNIGDFDSSVSIKTMTLPKEYLPEFNKRNPVRVLMGPQENYFTSRGIDTFLNSAYMITTQSDRMAFRLSGPCIEIAKGPDIITEPVSRGAIQVPGDGQPIILLRDAQVTGGYAKIATVICADLDRVVQKIPGEGPDIHFQRISRERSLELLREQKLKIEKISEFLQFS